MKQMKRKEVIPDDAVAVIWAASGEYVYETPLSEFEQKVKEAKEKEIAWIGRLTSMNGKRYAR